jgi:hypothetical protein
MAQQIHLGNGLCTCYGRENPGALCRVHREIARAITEQARTARAAAAQIATDVAVGYSPATSHATTCGMIATAILAMELGEGAG